MFKIRLFCAAGMSTSLLVTKMRAAAKEMGSEADIEAAGETKMREECWAPRSATSWPTPRRSASPRACPWT